MKQVKEKERFPMEKRNTHKTGIFGLDTMLNGGLIPERTYIISGPPGSGKTTLGIQFLMQGLKEGEKVLFVAVDEPPNEIKFNYSRFEWDISELNILDANSDIRRLEPTPVLDITSKSMMHKVSEIPDIIRKTKDFESVIVTIHSLQQAVRQIVDKEHISRLVIDSMSGVKYFCMEGLDENISTQSFMRFLAELRVTTFLLVETGESMPLTPELFLSRGEIRLHKWWSAGMLHRGISVELIRGSRHDETIRPMEITQHGIQVYAGINDWKKKTTSKPKKYREDRIMDIRADFALLEQSLSEAPEQCKGMGVDLLDITVGLESAKRHFDKGETLYAMEFIEFCKDSLQKRMAMPNSISKIMRIEENMAEYRARGMRFPNAEELLKRAKEFVNKSAYVDALECAQECEIDLTKEAAEWEKTQAEEEQKKLQQPSTPTSVQTVVQPAAAKEGTVTTQTSQETPATSVLPTTPQTPVPSTHTTSQPAQIATPSHITPSQGVSPTAKPTTQQQIAPASQIKPTVEEKPSPSASEEKKPQEPKPAEHKIPDTKPAVKQPPITPTRLHMGQMKLEAQINATQATMAAELQHTADKTQQKAQGQQDGQIAPPKQQIPQTTPVVQGHQPAYVQASPPPQTTQAQPAVPPPPPPPVVKLCPHCLKELSFIQQYNRYYCYTCKKYAPKGY